MTVLTILDEGYGWICPDCGGFKWQQSQTCEACWKERQRPADYWERRTCTCGQDKHRGSALCRSCAAVGNQNAAGRSQPGHPWRAKKFGRAA